MTIVSSNVILVNRFRAFLLDVRLRVDFRVFRLHYVSDRTNLFFDVVVLLHVSPGDRFVPDGKLANLRREERVVFRPCPCMPVIRILVSEERFSNSEPVRFVANG